PVRFAPGRDRFASAHGAGSPRRKSYGFNPKPMILQVPHDIIKVSDNKSMLSRRRFVQSSTLAALASVANARKLQTIGVQLYTVRNILPEKPAETLRALDALGYREAEGNFADLGKIGPSMQRLRIKLISVHMDIPTVMKGGDDDLSRAFAEVKKSGAGYAV